MAPRDSPSLAVFGATGGCAANALAAALRAGVSCVAMVRTPQKLRTMLLDQHRISTETLDANLTIVKGDILSLNDVKNALTITGRLPDKILFAVGGSPRFQFSLLAPITLDNLHICEEGIKTLLAALRACTIDHDHAGSAASTRPALICISTISLGGQRDLPYLYYPLEFWLLSIPRADKLALENTIAAAATESNSPVSDFAMVRPPLLTDGPSQGWDKVKASWVWHDFHRAERLAKGLTETGPQIGWSVARSDLGQWIFETLIKGEKSLDGKCWSVCA